MSFDSASAVHAGKLGAVLFATVAPDHAADIGQRIAVGESGSDFELLRGLLRAQALALVAACDEILWTDFNLHPLLRQDLDDENLTDLVRRTRQLDVVEIRDARSRAQNEADAFARASTEVLSTLAEAARAESIAPGEGRAEVVSRFVSTLEKASVGVPVPPLLQRQLKQTWFDYFVAAFCQLISESKGRLRQAIESEVLPLVPADTRTVDAVQAKLATASSTIGRYDELTRQRWRLDEILARLDKLAKPGSTVLLEGSRFGDRLGRIMPTTGLREWTRRHPLLAVFSILLVAALMIGGIWLVAGGQSVHDLLARRRALRTEGMPRALLQLSAWLGPEPIPSAIWNAEEARWPGIPGFPGAPPREELNAAAATLRDEKLCVADLRGWTVEPGARSAFRTTDAEGRAWWERATDLVLNVAPPIDAGPESLPRWQALAPHLTSLFESGQDLKGVETRFQRLIETTTVALLATRRGPSAPWETRLAVETAPTGMSDLAEKAWNRLAEIAGPYTERELPRVEAQFGKASLEAARFHRLIAELGWQKGQPKTEEHALIRAIRTLEQNPEPDQPALSRLQLRLGISRLLGADPEGGAESLAESVKLMKAARGETHPSVMFAQLSVARFYSRMRDFKSSWAFYQQAMETGLKIYQVPNRQLIAIHVESSELLLDFGQFEVVVPILARALEWSRAIEHPTSPELIANLRALATAEILSERKLTQGEAHLREVCSLVRQEYGPNSPEAWAEDDRLAAVILSYDEPQQAAEIVKLLEPRVPKGPALDDYATAARRGLLGRALHQSKRSAEAVPMLERALRGLGDARFRPSLLLGGCLCDLGEALIDTDRKGEGDRVLVDAKTELLAVIARGPREGRAANRLMETRRLRPENESPR